jgi:hypothetical protein
MLSEARRAASTRTGVFERLIEAEAVVLALPDRL